MEGHLDVFRQVLRGPVWDGDLASKAQRDLLKEAGFVESGYGFTYLSTKGVEAAVALGFLERGRNMTLFDVVKDLNLAAPSFSQPVVFGKPHV